jgi:hypothetical protein
VIWPNESVEGHPLIAVVPAWFAVVFTGECPRHLFDFNVV